MRIIFLYAALAVAPLFLASCGATGTNTATVSPGSNMVTVTGKDDNTTAELNRGDILTVELAANPTTGYQWRQAGGDPAILRQTGEPEFTPDTSAIGSPGKVDLRFEAAGPGQMKLQLEYRRSFEPETPAAKTFTINVAVK